MSGSQQQKGATLKAQTKNLAKFVEQLATETKAGFDRINQVVDRNAEILAAVVRCLGDETIDAQLREMRAEAKAQAIERAKSHIESLKGKKVLVPADIVTDDSYVVGSDKLPDGDEQYITFELAAVDPQVRALYLGKKAGDVIEVNGIKFTVTEIYSVDRKRFAELQAEEQAQLMKAQAQAAQSSETPSSELAGDKSVVEAPAESQEAK